MSNRIIKDTIAITVITLVAGLALGVVQDITADPIAKQEAQAKQDAYKNHQIKGNISKSTWQKIIKGLPAYVKAEAVTTGKIDYQLLAVWSFGCQLFNVLL